MSWVASRFALTLFIVMEGGGGDTDPPVGLFAITFDWVIQFC